MGGWIFPYRSVKFRKMSGKSGHFPLNGAPGLGTFLLIHNSAADLFFFSAAWCQRMN
jgi:hypothetical protein